MTKVADKVTNRLINEKSPYLLQHAYNPVNWYPWGDEAFEKARSENKPVFLSIGYSTCHWCHVFERESFEDNEVAEILNKHFVSIKVDREERPDIDTIYMQVCQAMTGHGGWPLSIFMTGDKKPFYAGTYFPKRGRGGMPGFIELLHGIAQTWSTEPEEINSISKQVVQAIEQGNDYQAGDIPGRETLDKAYQSLLHSFDEKHGGFGTAPKFPTPHNLLFLLRYWHLTKEAKALEMVEKTLHSMYQGGIYDHIGFGFCRYSTDQKWLAPHFEKMLYDNALLAWVYGETYQATQNPFYAKVVKEIYSYIFRDMTSPEGGFYSAEDADSEGEEGKFYTWMPWEVEEVLGPKTGQEFCRTYDITEQGNFEGVNIPNLIDTDITNLFEQEKQLLFDAREKRIHPFKDDKILTSWNGLLIASLAINGRILGDTGYIGIAEQGMGFILKNLRRVDGRLMARYRQGEIKELGIVDDYAFLIFGLIELFLATAKASYLKIAQELNNELLRLFWDQTDKGLFHYGNDGEMLFARPKELYDGATPSGNSVAAYNFLRLAHLTEDPALTEIAQQQLQIFGQTVAEAPSYYSFFLFSVLMNIIPPSQLQIITPQEGGFEQELQATFQEFYHPEMLTLILTELERAQLTSLIPSLADKKVIDNRPTAYLCHNFTCLPPITDSEELKVALK